MARKLEVTSSLLKASKSRVNLLLQTVAILEIQKLFPLLHSRGSVQSIGNTESRASAGSLEIVCELLNRHTVLRLL